MFTIIFIISAIKLLCFVFYHSTDFEVHRNWLAITHSLPLKEWYYENSSEWTLDYPPFFAWLEYFLSHFASICDKEIVNIKNFYYNSSKTIIFQRGSVVILDFLYIYSVKRLSSVFSRKNYEIFGINSKNFLEIYLIGNLGLVLVDHIHFQYNGFLYGILLLSLFNVLQGNIYLGALYFCILLNFKHLYLYMAPAFFIYMLRFFCFENKICKVSDAKSWYLLSLSRYGKLNIKKLCILSAIVLSVFMLSFGPFIIMGQMDQVLKRLFPFKRGLSHAYWAPNFWALYNFSDKLLEIGLGMLNVKLPKLNASMTGGLVQECDHTVMISIKPLFTLILSVIFMLPSLWKLWFVKDNPPRRFLETVILCSWVSFMFGWHVHEKAILMILLPFTFIIFCDVQYAKIFSLFSLMAHYSLLPLIFTQYEQAFIFFSFIIFECGKFLCLTHLSGVTKKGVKVLQFSWLELIYIGGFAFLKFYCAFLHFYLELDIRYPFIPLMFTSVYCALGNVYCFLTFYVYFLCSNRKQSIDKKIK